MVSATAPPLSPFQEEFEPENLFTRPRMYPLQLDHNGVMAHFIPCNRGYYSDEAFHDSRMVRKGAEVVSVATNSLLALYEEFKPVVRPSNYVFHIGFCRSTLMARCLDLPGCSVPYKEPSALTALSFERDEMLMSAASRLDRQPFDRRLRLTSALLSRTYEPAEVALVKVHDQCINLADDLLGLHPASAGIVMYLSLEDFLVKTLKERERREWIRDWLQRLAPSEIPILAATRRREESLSDAEAAATLWHVQLCRCLGAMSRLGARMRSLNGDDLSRRPHETLRAACAHFGLDLADAEIANILEGDHFRRDSKSKDRFELDKAEEIHRQSAARFRDEIDEGIRWCEQAQTLRRVPEILPRPLLAG